MPETLRNPNEAFIEEYAQKLANLVQYDPRMVSGDRIPDEKIKLDIQTQLETARAKGIIEDVIQRAQASTNEFGQIRLGKEVTDFLADRFSAER